MIIFKKILSVRKVKYTAASIMIIYFLLYLWSINYLNFSKSDNSFKLVFLSNWNQLIFKRSSTFLFEPIGYLELFRSIRILISPINILLGIFLSLLVFINIASVMYMYSLPKQCRIDTKFSGLVGILPSFLTGFACCVPSFLIPLASILGSTTAIITDIFIWILPVSIVLLLYGAISSVKKIKILQN